MASVSIYLNFNGNAEEAFNHYKKVFQTEFSAPIMRMGDIPLPEGIPELSSDDKKKVVLVALTIFGKIEIMAADILESLGQTLIEGSNVTISLNLDSKEDADRLFNELTDGDEENVAPHEEFWGYWGTCKDKFGIGWMFNISNSTQMNS